jgi:hydrogenase-1 operon protein HyaF
VSALDDIGVEVDAGFATGNIPALMHEIRHALARLLDTGEATTIDLANLPMAPGELDRFEALLGDGEVSAELTALGNSTIRETAYTGVWWVIHKNGYDQVVGRYIEITGVPEVLRAQTPDMQSALRRLDETLGNTNGNGSADTEA